MGKPMELLLDPETRLTRHPGRLAGPNAPPAGPQRSRLLGTLYKDKGDLDGAEALQPPTTGAPATFLDERPLACRHPHVVDDLGVHRSDYK